MPQNERDNQETDRHVDADAEYSRNLKAIHRGFDALKRSETVPAEVVFAEVAQVVDLELRR